MEKKRCQNFTFNEVDVLMSLVEEFKDIIECKRTDTVTNNRKELEWKKIEGRFNALCATARTAKMLRSKWDALKKSTKKEYAEHKQSLYKTGGGPGGSGILCAISLRILAIIGVGVTGTSSQFDSDFDNMNLFNSENELSVDNLSNSARDPPIHEEPIMFPAQVIQKEMTNNKDSLDESEIISLSSWKTWNPQQLRQPKSKALQVTEPNNADLSSDVCVEDCNGQETKIAEKTPLQLETPHCSSDIKKRKRFNKVEPISSKLRNKRASSEQLHEELLRKKIALVDLQTEILRDEKEQKKSMIDTQVKILREEAEQKKLQSAEKHKIEMEILLAELKNKNILLE